jgi:polyphosphate kinase
VEVVFPILDPRIFWRVLRILQTDLLDVKNSWTLEADGRYRRLWDTHDETAFNSQVEFMKNSYGICDTPE